MSSLLASIIKLFFYFLREIGFDGAKYRYISSINSSMLQFARKMIKSESSSSMKGFLTVKIEVGNALTKHKRTS